MSAAANAGSINHDRQRCDAFDVGQGLLPSVGAGDDDRPHSLKKLGVKIRSAAGYSLVKLTVSVPEAAIATAINLWQ